MSWKNYCNEYHLNSLEFKEELASFLFNSIFLIAYVLKVLVREIIGKISKKKSFFIFQSPFNYIHNILA